MKIHHQMAFLIVKTRTRRTPVEIIQFKMSQIMRASTFMMLKSNFKKLRFKSNKKFNKLKNML